MAAHRLLFVDSPTPALWSVAAHLRADGLVVRETSHTDDALDAAADAGGVVVLHQGADVDLHRVIERARQCDPDVVILAILDSSAGEPSPVLLAAAADHIAASASLDELARRITREVERAQMRRQMRASLASRPASLSVAAILGDSDAMARVRALVRKLTVANGVPTLITGERGTGRRHVARVIHDIGERRDQPLVAIDCARRDVLLPEALFGVELPSRCERGAIELADRGTLLIENVDRLPPDLQAGLLQLFEARTFRRIGGAVDLGADVRIIASTTRDLTVEVEAGHFRRDLLYRMNVVHIDLPPLRARQQDVLPLAEHFALQVAPDRPAHEVTFDDSARRALLSYSWPGNVRELRLTIERTLLVVAPRTLVTAADLPGLDEGRDPAESPFVLPQAGVDLEALQRRLVVDALDRAGGNQTRAAELLGMHRDQIRYRMRKYGLRG